MRHLMLTLPSTAENLALDEWLLQRSDSSPQPWETLRLWENPAIAVIAGRSSQIDVEVRRDFCRQQGIDIYRRNSGGAAVVIGPGCLMYAVVLDYRLRPELRMLDRAHQFVMQTMVQAMTACGVTCRFQGTCDLTLAGRKFSGNSLRCQRNSFLYHGTLLYDFDLDLLQGCLGQPPRQPDYRGARRHRDFVANLPVPRQTLLDVLPRAWGVQQTDLPPKMTEVESLAREKYDSRRWTENR